MNGNEVCKRMRAQPATRYIPVVVVTGLAEREDVIQALDCGADDFVNKPFDPAIMQARLKNFVRAKRTRDELENKIAVLLGGRAAERLVFGHFSTGAADDLVKATDIARSMVTRYGMEESLGHVAYDTQPPNLLGLPDERRMWGPQPSEASSERIDTAVSAILDRAFERTTELLTRHREILDRASRELLERETLDEADLRRLTAGIREQAGTAAE